MSWINLVQPIEDDLKNRGITNMMGDVIVGSENIFTTHDSEEMVIRANTLFITTVGLIQSL